MALPERKYYSLPKAASIAGCDVDDLIHFASIGMLQLCIKNPSYGFTVFRCNDESDDSVQPTVDIVSEYDFEALDKPAIDGYVKDKTGWDFVMGRYLSDYIRVVESFSMKTDRKVPHRQEGFLALQQEDIFSLEEFFHEGSDSDIWVNKFDIPRSKNFFKDENYILHGFEISDDAIVSISSSDFLITNDEMILLKSGGKKLDNCIGINSDYIERNMFPNEDEIANQKVNANKVGDFISLLISSIPELGGKVSRASAHQRHKIIQDFIHKKQRDGEFLDFTMPASATLEKYFKI